MLEENSALNLVEEYKGDKICYLTTSITEIILKAHAFVTHYKIQNESKEAYHLGHVAVAQYRSSHFINHVLSTGAKLSRGDLSIYLQEEKAKCFMNGIYAPAEGQHIDHHTDVHHLVPSCISEQDYKGVLKKRARAVFNGKIIVAPGAQHTIAKQNNKNLLLSASSEVDTKPQLEIFADDVVCTHGATVGQLDEEALFYLATRGIDRGQAIQYLTGAFAKDNLHYIAHQPLAEWMRTLLVQQLE